MKSLQASVRPVDVLGAVEVQTPSGLLGVEGLGRTVHVTASRARTYFNATARALKVSRSDRRQHLTRLDRGLRAADVELSFRIDRLEIARIGGRGRSGFVARGLGLPGLKIRYPALAAALVLRP